VFPGDRPAGSRFCGSSPVCRCWGLAMPRVVARPARFEPYNLEGPMSDSHEPEVLRPVIERRLLRAIFTAVGKLSREARGNPVVDDERQFRACVALARLAPAMLGTIRQEEVVDPIHPAYRAEAYKALLEMQAAQDREREEKQQQQLEQQQLEQQSPPKLLGEP
jgi:hypothetical protein